MDNDGTVDNPAWITTVFCALMCLKKIRLLYDDCACITKGAFMKAPGKSGINKSEAWIATGGGDGGKRCTVKTEHRCTKIRTKVCIL